MCQLLLDSCLERGRLGAAAQRLLQADLVSSDKDALLLRFPSSEFRSLCLNPLAKSGVSPAFPDDGRGIWRKNKLTIAGLVLLLADGCTSYNAQLTEFVDRCMERDSWALQRNLQDDQVPDDEKRRLCKRLELRRARLHGQFDDWCRALIRNPHFQNLKPVLQQVLAVEPTPQADVRRDGQRTEVAITRILERQLPPGWALHTQARIVAVDGVTFRNEKMLKGEADVLITDPHGIVQAIIEIKTAKGNPYLALYEDLQRLRNLVKRTSGRLVTVMPASSPQHGSSLDGNAAGASLDDPPADGPFMTTLRFSKAVKPVYVLGSAIAPEDLAAVVRSAHSKLLTMEFGRVLSSRIDAWSDVSVVEMTRDVVVLQVPPSSFPQCEGAVRSYFENLSSCEIFMAQTP